MLSLNYFYRYLIHVYYGKHTTHNKFLCNTTKYRISGTFGDYLIFAYFVISFEYQIMEYAVSLSVRNFINCKK